MTMVVNVILAYSPILSLKCITLQCIAICNPMPPSHQFALARTVTVLHGA